MLSVESIDIARKTIKTVRDTTKSVRESIELARESNITVSIDTAIEIIYADIGLITYNIASLNSIVDRGFALKLIETHIKSALGSIS